jgi:hypothetical protein
MTVYSIYCVYDVWHVLNSELILLTSVLFVFDTPVLSGRHLPCHFVGDIGNLLDVAQSNFQAARASHLYNGSEAHWLTTH